MAMVDRLREVLVILVFLSSGMFWSDSVVQAKTDSGDLAVLEEFRRNILNSELLNWPIGEDDPCGSKWDHILCTYAGRVNKIELQSLGLVGTLPSNLNQLTMLSDLGLQKNNFTGALPSLSGLSYLKRAFLDFNEFDMIPLDFFDGLTSLEVMALDQNPLNKTTGWMFPSSLSGSTRLVNLSCSGCNLVGELPVFLGDFVSLWSLNLSYNSLVGDVPASFNGMWSLGVLKLNNQESGNMLTGNIDFLPSMTSITVSWLHGNSFTGSIPANITLCDSLKYFVVNNNKLTGVVPESLSRMPQLEVVKLDTNLFLGPVPVLPKTTNFTYDYNSFCQMDPGELCASDVKALLDFLGGVNYPLDLAASWKGNDPCRSWFGISCVEEKITVVNIENQNLTGTISSSLGRLDSLTVIKLGGNGLSGTVPESLAEMSSLKLLDIAGNNLKPPLPKFSRSVDLRIENNPLLDSSSSCSFDTPSAKHSSGTWSTKFTDAVIVSAWTAAALVSCLVAFCIHRNKKKKDTDGGGGRGGEVDRPQYFSGDGLVKITVARSRTLGGSNSDSSFKLTDNSETLLISLATLRYITQNFSPENVLGRGGFGVVYKGEFEDGLILAVKRMESSPIAVNTKAAMGEFHSEISALSKLRHRNLVSLLGYSVESNERLLVYEYMSHGALSTHLFHWKHIAGLQPLSWMTRLSIALDIARGVEYLHTLASQSFIHRDLKSSNVLLGKDYRAKIADFGLVKSAPDGAHSVATRLAGTFGYLAPEYAITGKITTKADVFSFGVVLMELVTGLAALDDNRPEETRHLATWFPNIITNEEKLKAAIDPSLVDVAEITSASISVVAELAGHCTERNPRQRPDMGHAVNVLSPLVEKWKPKTEDAAREGEASGISRKEVRQPLLQMVKDWQSGNCGSSQTIVDDSRKSFPSGPISLATTFTSSDCR